MLTVHGDIRSGNCLKVKWMLDSLGRDYRWVEVDIMWRRLDLTAYPHLRHWIGRTEGAFGI